MNNLLKKNLTNKKYFYFFKKLFKTYNIKLLFFFNFSKKKYNYFFFKKFNLITVGLVSEKFKENLFDIPLFLPSDNLTKLLLYKLIYETYILNLYNNNLKYIYMYRNYLSKKNNILL